MTELRYDAIIVGAGHNGLACAVLLAEAGKRVLVLEARHRVGGAALTREFADGFYVSSGAHLLHQLQPKVFKDLGIRLPMANDDMPTIVLDPEGQHVRFRGTMSDGVSEADANAFAEFMRLGRKLARFLDDRLLATPPRLGTGETRESVSLARLAFDLRRLGRSDMQEFLRLVGQNIYDEVDGRFDSDLLKAALCLDAVTGSHAGPRSPGTMISWLYRLAGSGGRIAQPAGGFSAISDRLAKRAIELGVTIHVDTPVDAIAVENGRVAGVQTHSERYLSWTVISNADPKTTVMQLVGPQHFETTFTRRIEHFRTTGNVAKLHLALDTLPEIGGLTAEDLAARLVIAPSAGHIEQAFNPAKYGAFSETPVLEISIPSVTDAICAPEGQHVMSVIAQYAPCDLDGGWTEDARFDFEARIMAVLESCIPGLSKLVIASELLTPLDFEHDFGTTGGHWHHGEIALDQFFFVRPVAGAAQYALPLDGLWLCGAGAHPGGGVHAIPGRNAAREILAQERVR